MFKKVLLTLVVVTMVVGVAYARDVSVTNVSVSNVNANAGTCTINYELTRTQPAIDANQPIWVFVKYRLSTDTDMGIVTSGGTKQITWTWGASGTGLSSTDSVRVRVYAVDNE